MPIDIQRAKDRAKAEAERQDDPSLIQKLDPTQPEFTEIAIEMHSLFTQNCYLRLAGKIVAMCEQYSAAQADAQRNDSKPVSESLKRESADL